jgi:hypothetical protein
MSMTSVCVPLDGVQADDLVAFGGGHLRLVA